MFDVWIFTNCFPYEPGEQFLETEIRYWANLKNGKVTIFPCRAIGLPRVIQSGISIDLRMTKSSFTDKLFSMIRAIFSSFFWQEIFWLKREGLISLRSVYFAWATLATIFVRSKKIENKLLRSKKNQIIVYSYWFDITSYALALLRKNGTIPFLVSRAHGYDVYEELRPNKYMPYKRQFASKFDIIFPISKITKSYLHDRYHIPERNLAIARLGVMIEEKISLPSPNNNINLLSVSFCRPIKRIDKIIDGLHFALQSLDRDILVNWIHIGDGNSRQYLEHKARYVSDFFSNFSFKFTGNVTNFQVMQYYRNNNVDVFINTSESEGIPVSIMEAMSFGVPAIAPSVGGITELVNQENGILLPDEPSIDEIAQAIGSIDHYKHSRTRQAARDMIVNHYNANTNYNSFIQKVCNFNYSSRLMEHKTEGSLEK